MAIKWPGFKDLRVHENVDFAVGSGCRINGMAIDNNGVEVCPVKPKVRIGNNLHAAAGCVIRTSDHDFRRGFPMVNRFVSGYAAADVVIGDDVWIGNSVLIMKGVTIGDGAVIQARSVVVSNIPRLAIAGGHPCRTFAYRDEEEYDFFKSLNLTNVSMAKIVESKEFFAQKFAEFQAEKAKRLAPPA